MHEGHFNILVFGLLLHYKACAHGCFSYHHHPSDYYCITRPVLMDTFASSSLSSSSSSSSSSFFGLSLHYEACAHGHLYLYLITIIIIGHSFIPSISRTLHLSYTISIPNSPKKSQICLVL